MFSTPPVTRSRTRGRPLVGSNNRQNAAAEHESNDCVLNSTFQGEAEMRNSHNVSARAENNIQFDMTQIQEIISDSVAMGISNLANQLPNLINSAIDNRFRQMNHIPPNSSIPIPQQNVVNDSLPDNDSHGVSPMSRWNLKFSGSNSGISVNDFIFRVETLRQRQNLTWSHVCANFHLLLSEKADEWYWVYLKRQSPSNWTDLRSALIKEFRHRNSDFEILKSIMDFKQENRSFDEFVFKVVKLNEQMVQPLDDDKLLEIVRGNLNFRLWQLTFSAAIRNFEELKDFCRNAERQLSSRQMVRRQVNEIEVLDQEELAMVDEVIYGNNRKILTCWNCDQKGHSYFDCSSPQRRLFCYKCGQKDVTSPNCNKCKPHLNFQRDGLDPEQIRLETHPEMN